MNSRKGKIHPMTVTPEEINRRIEDGYSAAVLASLLRLGKCHPDRKVLKSKVDIKKSTHTPNSFTLLTEGKYRSEIDKNQP